MRIAQQDRRRGLTAAAPTPCSTQHARPRRRPCAARSSPEISLSISSARSAPAPRAAPSPVAVTDARHFGARARRRPVRRRATHSSSPAHGKTPCGLASGPRFPSRRSSISVAGILRPAPRRRRSVPPRPSSTRRAVPSPVRSRISSAAIAANAACSPAIGSHTPRGISGGPSAVPGHPRHAAGLFHGLREPDAVAPRAVEAERGHPHHRRRRVDGVRRRPIPRSKLPITRGEKFSTTRSHVGDQLERA